MYILCILYILYYIILVSLRYHPRVTPIASLCHGDLSTLAVMALTVASYAPYIVHEWVLQ